MIHNTRIQPLNDRSANNGKYVLYWMQQSQRSDFNHALEYAIERANALRLPLLVAFGLMDDYPEANLRSYAFMLQGLRETEQLLRARGIGLVIRRGHPEAVALALGRDASVIVCDRGYLRHQKAWRKTVAGAFEGEAVQVEADAIVPVEMVSNKAEHAARTIRPKIRKHLGEYLVALAPRQVARDSLSLVRESFDLGDLEQALGSLNLDQGVRPARQFRGGTSVARVRLGRFIDDLLADYAADRNRPEEACVSCMSMYLHFGQISPVYLALQVQKAAASDADRSAYLDELIVRRELAINFVEFTQDYDRYTSVPEWARATLEMHRGDERAHRYTMARLEAADTHDPYWNAAMREMKHTGYMHNYMRMYWGKKILEWSKTPETAYRLTLALNNRYFLDGRDPASYANVGWLFGLHDRPWPSRPVYGSVRAMSSSGLERKADMAAYIARVDELVEQSQGE